MNRLQAFNPQSKMSSSKHSPAHTPGANAEQALKEFIRSETNDVSLDVWIRERLCGVGGMGNDLKYRRAEAAVLRQKADEMEARAVQRLADDILAEWQPLKILKAVHEGQRARAAGSEAEGRA